MSETAQYTAINSDIRGGKWHSTYVVCALVFAVFIAYGNSIDGELVGDSRELVMGNSHIHQPWNLGKIWTSNYWGDVLYAGNYRPISVWSYALNYWFSSAMGWATDGAWSYRMVNVLLHAGVSWGVYILAGLWRVGVRGKWIAAIAFAWHPLHVEAVVSVVGRAECLASLAGIGFLYLDHKRRPVLASFVLLLAMWSKESALAFVAVALWADCCWSNLSKRDRLKSYSWYGIVVIGWLALRSYALSGHETTISFLDNPLVEADWVTRIRTAIAIQGKYVQLMVWPFGYSSDYSHAQIVLVESWSDPRWYVPTIAFAASCWGVWWMRSQVVAVVWGSYWLLAVPTANVFLLIGTIMGERLTYAPTVMAAILWGWCLERALRLWSRGVTVCLVLLSILWCLLCVQRSQTWYNRDVYHRAQLRDAPASARAHMGIGSYYMEVGKVDSALYHAILAARIYPDYPEAQYNWGVGLSAQGQWAEAVLRFERAVELNSSLYQSWYNLGLARHKIRDFSGATRAYKRALLLRGEDAETWFNLGVAQWQLGAGAEAVDSLRYACELKPDWREGWRYLASVAKALNELEIERYALGKMRLLP